jgi:hypothetical protein
MRQIVHGALITRLDHNLLISALSITLDNTSRLIYFARIFQASALRPQLSPD